jgi:hypothetical protein
MGLQITPRDQYVYSATASFVLLLVLMAARSDKWRYRDSNLEFIATGLLVVVMLFIFFATSPIWTPGEAFLLRNGTVDAGYVVGQDDGQLVLLIAGRAGAPQISRLNINDIVARAICHGPEDTSRPFFYDADSYPAACPTVAAQLQEESTRNSSTVDSVPH